MALSCILEVNQGKELFMISQRFLLSMKRIHRQLSSFVIRDTKIPSIAALSDVSKIAT
jgi:hypothetical protein